MVEMQIQKKEGNDYSGGEETAGGGIGRFHPSPHQNR